MTLYKNSLSFFIVYKSCIKVFILIYQLGIKACLDTTRQKPNYGP